MFCPQCGAAVSGGENLCPLCGAVLSPPDGAPQPPPEDASPFSTLLAADEEVPGPGGPPPGPAEETPPPLPRDGGPKIPPAPLGPPKKRRAGLIVGICAAVAVIAAAVLALPAILQAVSPTAFVAASMGRTMAAMGESLGELGFGGVFQSAAENPTRQTFSVSVPGGWLDGFSLLMEQDPKGKKAACSFSLDSSGDSFVSLRTFIEGDLLSFTSPELLENRWYALHTETLGRDFNASIFRTDSNAMEEDYGFNFFQPSRSASREALHKAMAGLWKEYGPAMTVKKTETGVPAAAGWALTGDVYHLNFPADALREYVRGALYALGEDEAFLQASMIYDYVVLGMRPFGSDPEEFWQEYRDGIYDKFDALADGIQSDLDMDFYIADKLVRRVTAECTYASPDGGGAVAYRLSAVFGTEDSLPAALSVSLNMDSAYGEQAALLFDYDGGRQGGVYDCTAALSASRFGSAALEFLFTTSLRYDPQNGDFFFSLDIPGTYDDGVQFTARGTVLLPEPNSLLAELETSVSDGFSTGAAFATRWSVAPMADFSFRSTAPVLLFSMTREDYADFQQTLSDNLIGLLQSLY